MSSSRVLSLWFCLWVALISILAFCPTSTLSKPESEVFVADGYVDEGSAAAADAIAKSQRQSQDQDQRNENNIEKLRQNPERRSVVTDVKDERVTQASAEAPRERERALESHTDENENKIGNEIGNEIERESEHQDSTIQRLQNSVTRLEGAMGALSKESQYLRQELEEMNTTLSKFVHATGGIRRVFACEYTLLTLQCEIGRIRVNSAFYGRVSKDICDGSLRMFQQHKSSQVINCLGKDSDLQVVQKMCDSNQSCNVMASNRNFGDPCLGIIKYLQVNYQCIV